jgi:signal peptidase II
MTPQLNPEPRQSDGRTPPGGGEAVAPRGGPPGFTATALFSYRWFWLVAGCVLAFDQLTKHWISRRLPFGSYGPGARLEVFPGFMHFVHVGNTGAAWSMFSGKSLGLAVLASGTLVAIFLWRRQLGLRQLGTQLAFGLLCGGIVGNLLDRLVLGHVVDFIDLQFGSYTYPTFNVADSGICVGVFWYVLSSLRQPDQK